MAAKYAIGSLQTFFLKNLSKEGRLQVETLFATVGALTGFAAQHAVGQEYVATGRANETDISAIVESKSGERYYLGDQLNAVLVPERRESLAVWSIIAGEAMCLGASKRDLPDCIEIFDRVVKSIGTSENGNPRSIPGHARPWLTPRQAIAIFWQVVFAAFANEPVPPVPDFNPIEQCYWPLVPAMVAARYLSIANPVFPPALAVGLYMEAANSMSKMDPAPLNSRAASCIESSAARQEVPVTISVRAALSSILGSRPYTGRNRVNAQSRKRFHSFHGDLKVGQRKRFWQNSG